MAPGIDTTMMRVVRAKR